MRVQLQLFLQEPKALPAWRDVGLIRVWPTMETQMDKQHEHDMEACALNEVLTQGIEAKRSLNLKGA